MRERRIKKRLIWGTIAVLVIVLLCVVLYTPPSPDLNDVLAAAGLAALPESVTDLTFDSQGGLFRTETIRLAFGAEREDIDRWIVSSPRVGFAGEPFRDVPPDVDREEWRLDSIHSNWWAARIDLAWRDVYQVRSKTYTGLIIINDHAETVFVHLTSPRSWLDRLRKHLPFS